MPKLTDEVQKVTIRYPAGHHRTSQWKHTLIFCPNCGKANVWHEDGDGDYYVGETYVCLDCRVDFTIQGPSPAEDVYVKVIEELSEGKSNAGE